MKTRRLFERHYARLVRFLYRRLGDRARAEELAQETFLRLLARPRGIRRPESWLYAVAANLARDEARGAARQARRLELLAGEWSGRSAPGPEEALLRDETARAVRAALDALSERDRALLLLREEGLAYREIGEVLGVSATSVGPLLTRAQRRFLKRYEGTKERGRGDDEAAAAP